MSIRFNLLETTFARNVNTRAFSRPRVITSFFQKRPLLLQRIGELQGSLKEAKSYASTLQFLALAVEYILNQSLHDLCSGSQDHHPFKNSVQKTVCCNSTSNAPDDGRIYPKHVELRIHQ